MSFLYTNLRWYAVNFVYPLAFFTQPYKNKQGLILTITYLSFVLAPTPLHGQELSPSETAIIEQNISELSDKQLLRRAKSLRDSDHDMSAQLATEALRLAKASENMRLSAQAHSLLGKLAKETKNTKKAQQHFLQASILYQDINDKRNQILSSIDYVSILFLENRYDDADQALETLLPIAQQYGDELPIAQTFIAQGDSFFKQRRYREAITEYTNAASYLSEKDNITRTRLASAYNKIAQANKNLNNREQSISFYKKSLNIYTKLHDKESMARVLNDIARGENLRGNFLIALDYAIQSVELHRQLNKPKALAKSLSNLGITYRKLDRYEQSIAHIYEAHVIYKSVNDTTEIAETSNQIGLIYTRLNQYDLAKSFYLHTVELPEKEVKPKTRAAALREIAVIEMEAKNYELAIKLAEEAHKIYQKEHNTLKSSYTARILGRIYREMEDKGQAIAYSREAVSLASKTNDERYQVKALTLLGSNLIDENTDEAIDFLTRSFALAKKINMPSEQLYSCRWLRKAEKSRGNISNSLRYAEQEILLLELIQNESEKNELVKAKANLDSYKMEMELNSLKKQAELDQLELAKKNNEIEIALQANKISDLELLKNRYASIALASLLAICLLVSLFIYKRFTDSRKRNKELDYLAARDPLTNCYNRRILFDLMNRDFADLEQLEEYCIIMTDIDHFKEVNDSYGHGVGDTVLRSIANIIQGSIRQKDIAARYGGEEFCIILPDADQNHALRIAENMRNAIQSAQFEDIAVTCSFGVSSIRFNAKTPTELINQADLALYKSKTHGRNKVSLWNSSLKNNKRDEDS